MQVWQSLLLLFLSLILLAYLVWDYSKRPQFPKTQTTQKHKQRNGTALSQTALVVRPIKIPPSPTFIPGRTYNEGSMFTVLHYSDNHMLLYVREKQHGVRRNLPVGVVIYNDRRNNRYIIDNNRDDPFIAGSFQAALAEVKSLLPVGKTIEMATIKPDSERGRKLERRLSNYL